MRRLLIVSLPALVCMLLSTSALAQKPVEKGLRFKVDLGGMNIGQFTSMTMPSHSITLQGDNVLILPQTNAQDARPIVLTGGSIGSMMTKILTPRVGEQMTVGIQVVTVGAGPGRRCTFTLDHAFLKKLQPDGLTLRPSELPKFVCKEK